MPILSVNTVIDDQVKDVLSGGNGLDWFWAGELDKIDKKDDEQFGPFAP